VVSVKVNERAAPRTETFAARPPRSAMAEPMRADLEESSEEATSQVA